MIMAESVPFKLAGYQLTEKRYQSQRSVIYRALRESDQHPIALKFLNKDYPDAADIARLKREHQLLQRLALPGLLESHGLERYDDDNMALVLEDFAGQPLSSSVSQPLPLSLFFKIALQTTEVLEQLEQQGYSHHNIHPGNLLWNSNTEELRLNGVWACTSLPVESGYPFNPLSDFSIGSISPEQTGRMNRRVDSRTSFYSLGVTFYYLLTGHSPYTAADTLGWIYCHIAKTPMALCAHNRPLPVLLGELILKLMAKNPDDRYQTMTGLLRDLQRCKQAWSETGAIASFALGQHDRKTWQFPDRLYGRDEEVAEILSHFAKACAGQLSMVLIKGAAGVGKTALVKVVRRQIQQTCPEVLYGEGKYEQFGRNLPYRALVQALSGVIDGLLSLPEQVLVQWRACLKTALGANAAIMTAWLPCLEQVLGTPPAVPELPARETRNRFQITVRNFINVFACKAHPLVLFLDDLQWSDPASLSLLRDWVESEEVDHLLVLGAYRQHEITSEHPLQHFLSTLESYHSISELALRPCTPETVNQLIVETLHCSVDASQALAQQVYHKTEGNPFYIKTLLSTWVEQGLIYYASDAACWQWRLDEIHRATAPEPVLTLLMRRLQHLSAFCQLALQQSACIGNGFELQFLSLINNETPTETATLLEQAVQQGIISVNKPVIHHQDITNGFDGTVTYQFQHDHLQQAAYALNDDDRRNQRMHLRIGRLMLQHTPVAEQESSLIPMVQQFNAGRELITDTEEQHSLCQLNLKAAQQIKPSAAYEAALEHVCIAKELLAEDSWATDYELSFAVFKEFTDCTYLCGDFESGEAHSQILLERARNRLEKADIYLMQCRYSAVHGRPIEAIQKGLAGLALFGIQLSIKTSKLMVLY